MLIRNALRSTLAAAALLAAPACGSDNADRSSSKTADTPSVALLTSGPVSDAGWHAGAYEGLQLIRDSLGFQVSHQQTRTPAEFDEAFISYAQAGYGLIFGHGFEYQDAATRVGPQFPDVTFVVSSGSRPGPNVVPLVFHLNEASYLAGMAAGAVTQSGIVGMVGGVEIPAA
ncbi:MAG: BMP family ABC transporter substrate-binding protein, partial [Gemmatimonadetes bacterium]|nr:BMP family ABC transporter substrate-binding protein [Gemmatimonadota bacterium]